MKRYYALKGIKMGIFFIAMVAFGGFVLMTLWNWLVPEIFGLTAITWVQALGLLALSRILFGNWGGGKSRGRHQGKNKKKWEKRWKEKMAEMTPEQRARMKEKFSRKGRSCGWEDENEAEVVESTEAPKTDPFQGGAGEA